MPSTSAACSTPCRRSRLIARRGAGLRLGVGQSHVGLLAFNASGSEQGRARAVGAHRTAARLLAVSQAGGAARCWPAANGACPRGRVSACSRLTRDPDPRADRGRRDGPTPPCHAAPPAQRRGRPDSNSSKSPVPVKAVEDEHRLRIYGSGMDASARDIELLEEAGFDQSA